MDKIPETASRMYISHSIPIPFSRFFCYILLYAALYCYALVHHTDTLFIFCQCPSRLTVSRDRCYPTMQPLNIALLKLRISLAVRQHREKRAKCYESCIILRRIQDAGGQSLFTSTKNERNASILSISSSLFLPQVFFLFLYGHKLTGNLGRVTTTRYPFQAEPLQFYRQCTRSFRCGYISSFFFFLYVFSVTQIIQRECTFSLCMPELCQNFTDDFIVNISHIYEMKMFSRVKSHIYNTTENILIKRTRISLRFLVF